MSYVLTPDRTTLPAALLPIAKDHLRISFTDDDAQIQRMIGYAIAYFEKFTELSVFGGSVAWSPVLVQGVSAYQTPLQPVRSFTVFSGAVDVSTQYRLLSRSLTEPVFLEKIDGTDFPANAVITLATGYAALADLDPSIEATLLRVTATLYEHRESITTLTLDQVPGWASDLMGGHWIPRA